MRWTPWRQAGFGSSGETFTADGEVVWSWRRDPGVKLSGKARMATVARKAASPGRARNKPSNHCVGKAGMTGCTCGDLLVSFFTFGREAAGAVGARLSLRPLLTERDNEFAELGRKPAARMRTLTLIAV